MKKGTQPKSNLRVTGIAKYLENRNIRDNTPSIYSDSGTDYFYEGEMIPEDEFLKMFPLVLIPVNFKGENCDHTKIK